MTKKYSQVENYSFKSFTESDVEVDKVVLYEYQPLLNKSLEFLKKDYQKIIKEERVHAKQSQFKFNPIVEKFRGLKDQEEKEYQDKVNDDVAQKVLEIHEQAYAAGFKQGKEDGREEIFNEMRNVVDQKIEDFNQMISDVLKTQEDMLSLQKKEICLLINNLSKWIILRELKEDGKYVERLFEKLLLEIQTRNNLLVLVNPAGFSLMPEVLEHVKLRLGELKNVRIEIDSSILTSGMIVESDNGIINATLEEQFKSLDKLFEDVLEAP